MLRFSFAIIGCLILALPVHGQTIQDEKVYNDRVRHALLEQGDDGRAPREVQHWAFPSQGGAINPVQRRTIIADLQNNGFQAEGGRNSGVTFKHVTAVSGKDFDGLTMSLRAYLHSKGWSYDGWETFVMRKGTK